MKLKHLLNLIVVSVLFVGCASVNSVSLTQIPAVKKNAITAETSKTIFLGFNFDNDFVDQITEQLKQRCSNGVISGILTKDEVISYFLFHTRKITATGYCNSTTTASK